jgi:hypothetical protein
MPETTYAPDPKGLFTPSRGFDCTCGTGTGTGGLAGIGSPEGVVTASPGTTYLDTSTNGFWVKNNGTGNTGWFQEIA